MKEDLIKFNETMQELMEVNKLNNVRLSENVGIDRKTMTHWFSGKFYPTLESLIKLTKYFNCSIDYLFGLTDRFEFNPKNISDFVSRFIEITKEKGITDYRVAKLCGVGNSTVAKWRLHGRIPETETLIKLSKIFECSVEYLIGRC